MSQEGIYEISGLVALSSHDPGPAQGGTGRLQSAPSGPRLPMVLQKAKTAHLASKLILFTSGFLYSFLVFFSTVSPCKCSVSQLAREIASVNPETP